ncbi:hypothetical protein TNCV_2581361 [Trichonephila clavipes]|nr:hypothetical protein TNCV_2581361 [Trichonephila clavipes]
MIEGYQKFLTTFKQEKDEHGVHKQLQESLKETIAARDQLREKRKISKITRRGLFPPKPDGVSAQDDDVTLLPHLVHQSPCHSRH